MTLKSPRWIQAERGRAKTGGGTSATRPGRTGPVAGRSGPGNAGNAEDSLAGLLRTGPFERALRAAVAASGLSLDRIQDRLNRRGARISVATLSFWQSGRYRPERASSLRVPAELEDILGLAPESLRALLGPPRPRPTTPCAPWSLTQGCYARMRSALSSPSPCPPAPAARESAGTGAKRRTAARTADGTAER